MSMTLFSTYLTQIRTRAYGNTAVILHYDPESQDLCPWFWPVDEVTGRRVTPESLQQYRVTHVFKGPSCLCSSIMPGSIYTETAMYVAMGGEFVGEYVCACATDTCGYMVCLERMYSMRALLLKQHDRRAADDVLPRPVMRFSGLAGIVHQPSSGAVRNIGIHGALAAIPTYQRPPKRVRTVMDRLLALNSSTRPGLSESDFRKLFAKCRCGLIMTQRAFKRHACVEVVDLASESSESDSSRSSPSPAVIDLTASDVV